MKRSLIIYLMAIMYVVTFGQVPESFKYQAVIRNSAGEIVSEKTISVRISIVKGSEIGDIVYRETHSVTTNQFGLIYLNIGQGNTTDDFSSINWGNDNYYTQIELDTEGGANYSLLGASQLLSVPYALYSKNVENLDDSDADSTNEIQILTISNDTIFLENGGFVKLPEDKYIDSDSDSTNEIQEMTISNDTIYLSKTDSNYIKLPQDKIDDADNNTENEIQFFSVSNTGDTLFLNSSNYVIIPGVSIANPYLKDSGTFVDSRDTQEYKWIKIGSQVWMGENLNIGLRIDGTNIQSDNGIIEKYCYNNNELKCDTFGGLYQWDEIMQYNPSDSLIPGTTQGACPDGWHVPTELEWRKLIQYLGGEEVAGGKMKLEETNYWISPNEGATNESSFSALPAGMLYDWGTFMHIYEHADFWSATESNINWPSRIYLRYYSGQALINGSVKGRSYSVRCIKD